MDVVLVFFFKQKTAYEMRISDWSSDVCSSDLPAGTIAGHAGPSYAGSDSLRVRLVGKGAHGSMPENSVDPVVMAAETVLRLQTVKIGRASCRERVCQYV